MTKACRSKQGGEKSYGQHLGAISDVERSVIGRAQRWRGHCELASPAFPPHCSRSPLDELSRTPLGPDHGISCRSTLSDCPMSCTGVLSARLSSGRALLDRRCSPSVLLQPVFLPSKPQSEVLTSYKSLTASIQKAASRLCSDTRLETAYSGILTIPKPQSDPSERSARPPLLIDLSLQRGTERT